MFRLNHRVPSCFLRRSKSAEEQGFVPRSVAHGKETAEAGGSVGRERFFSGFFSAESNFFIGIDEAGRGSLAGPLVVGGVRVARHFLDSEFFSGIRDSKKLSPRAREEWFSRIGRETAIVWVTARVSVSVIDRIGIARAADLGALRVFRKLARGRSVKVLLDGGLSLPKKIFHEAVIKGDEKIPLIAAASIVAKVVRDRIMARLSRRFPGYDFEIHKGYGTPFHRGGIARLGPSPIHRRSFRLL
jgi:ribonuclease HII